MHHAAPGKTHRPERDLPVTRPSELDEPRLIGHALEQPARPRSDCAGGWETPVEMASLTA
jgi:hypothetical protein